MSTPDPDCNRVAYWPAYPDVVHRCTMPHGHVPHCWGSAAVETPAHRLPVETVEDPLGLRRQGGKHRLFLGAGSGPGAVDSELQRRLAHARAGFAVVEA